MTLPASRCAAFRSLPRLGQFNTLALCGAVVALAALLWPQWRQDDNLSHGIFLPFLAAIMIFESRRDANPRFLRPGAGPLAACAILVLASLASLAVAMVYAAALGWTHAMAEFLVSVALVLALGAGWLSLAENRVRFLPLNWQAAVAVALWLFSAPPPPGTYARIALYLQTQVTHEVVRVMNAFAIAAYQNGNVIELARTSVGVSEACSGVRSLVSCTVAGLFLSALLVRRPANRMLVIALSPAIGLAMNFLRSLLLTLLANAGVNIEGRWHDLTGASIIVGTTILVAAFAFWLRGWEPAPKSDLGAASSSAGRSRLPVVVAAGLLAACGAIGIPFASHRTLPSASRPPLDLASLLPPPPPGWTARTTPDLDSYSGILHTHALVERVYMAGPTAESGHITLYLAYWRPGEAPVSLVDAHTPDACWPGTGWEPEPVQNERPTLAIDGRSLAPAECRLFAHNTIRTRVWFWHLYGGQPLVYVDPYSAVRLLKLTLHYGFNQPRDQLFVRVSSDKSWPEIASQPTLRQFFENLRPLGL